MYGFRLVLLAVGLVFFLVVRFLADAGAPTSTPVPGSALPPPPCSPETAPVEAPHDPHPFLRMSTEVVFANILWTVGWNPKPPVEP